MSYKSSIFPDDFTYYTFTFSIFCSSFSISLYDLNVSMSSSLSI